MKKFVLAALGASVLSIGLWASATSASALGDCGPNRHRTPGGFCVWGGQNQQWCLRHTGHVAGHRPIGTRWCR